MGLSALNTKYVNTLGHMINPLKRNQTLHDNQIDVNMTKINRFLITDDDF